MVLPSLESLGRRIMICGTSNAGKSTLAAAIGRKLELPAVYLDQFRFLENTDWQERPDDEFAALHDAAIEGEAWVIEGNYSMVTPQRLRRATGIILLSDNRFANFARYLRRTVFQKDRIGALEGSKDSLKWSMVKWVLVQGPRRLKRYGANLSVSGLPLLKLHGMAEINDAYAGWGLTRPR